MTNAIRLPRSLAIASLALAFTAAPIAITATAGLQGLTAAAREAESGGKHQGGDNKGGDRHGGRTGGDDNSGGHDQHGKDKK